MGLGRGTGRHGQKGLKKKERMESQRSGVEKPGERQGLHIGIHKTRIGGHHGPTMAAGPEFLVP